MRRRRYRDTRIRHDLGRAATSRVITYLDYLGADQAVPRPAVPTAPVLPVRPL